jgi:hypothetical protein
MEGEMPSTLPAPDALTGDPMTMIAKLFVKSAQQKRESNAISSRAAEQAEDAADAKRIDAMKEKADMSFLAGVSRGVGEVASGALLIKGGCARGDAGKVWEGAGGIPGGAGKIAEAGFKSLSDAADREIEKESSAAKTAKRAQDALTKEVDGAAQHQAKITQLLQEIKQAQTQCERAVIVRA